MLKVVFISGVIFTVQSRHPLAHILTPKEFDSISAKLKKLEHKKEILQLSGCLTDIPLQKKLAALKKIHEENDQFSIHELCDALDVARGTFYNHILRRSKPRTYAEEQTQLMLKVQQIFDDSSQRFGAEKIRAVLAANGIQASKRHVSAIMQELGLHSVRPDAKNSIRNSKNRLGTICCSAIFQLTVPIKSGSVISLALRSILTGCTFALFLIFILGKLLDIKYLVMLAPGSSHQHFEKHSKLGESLKI